MTSSQMTSLQVLQASRLAAAAASARQQAFYGRVLGMSIQAANDHALPQPVSKTLSTDLVKSGAFRPVHMRFHPYD